ncbi:hypothetical protein RQN30_01600 [Arcanobacterium hippocoleae]
MSENTRGNGEHFKRGKSSSWKPAGKRGFGARAERSNFDGRRKWQSSERSEHSQRSRGFDQSDGFERDGEKRFERRWEKRDRGYDRGYEGKKRWENHDGERDGKRWNSRENSFGGRGGERRENGRRWERRDDFRGGHDQRDDFRGSQKGGRRWNSDNDNQIRRENRKSWESRDDRKQHDWKRRDDGRAGKERFERRGEQRFKDNRGANGREDYRRDEKRSYPGKEDWREERGTRHTGKFERERGHRGGERFGENSRDLRGKRHELISEIPPSISAESLDPGTRAHLRNLNRENAEIVARHLAYAGEMLDIDPEVAYRHAKAAFERAARVDVVREALGITAYVTGRYQEALSELRTYRRMSNDFTHVPMEADAERGMGRSEKALRFISEIPLAQLSPEAKIELALVTSGARADLGDSAGGLAVVEKIIVANLSAELAARVELVRADRLAELGRDEEADILREKWNSVLAGEDDSALMVVDLHDVLDDEIPVSENIAIPEDGSNAENDSEENSTADEIDAADFNELFDGLEAGLESETAAAGFSEVEIAETDSTDEADSADNANNADNPETNLNADSNIIDVSDAESEIGFDDDDIDWEAELAVNPEEEFAESDSNQDEELFPLADETEFSSENEKN